VKLTLENSRRLTGANLYWDLPAAIIDVMIEGNPETVLRAWESAALKWLDSVGYADEKTCYRTFEGGASLLISAPIDVLYSMCELNEVAWASAVHACGGGAAPDEEEEIPRLNRLFDEERNPPLLALQDAARQRDAPFLWDDDEVSLGFGASTQIWAPDQVPSPEAVDWEAVSSIPVAMVTGTNGKSTTVRMVASIMGAAGRSAGLTSTDYIRVGGELLDKGDYSGTGGARMLMRHPEVEMAVLEVARGGLLRRGLGVERVDAALITNVAADHLGEYGINTVPELIEAKFIVRRALKGKAPLILNADDEGVVGFARALDQPITWFGLDPLNPLLRQKADQDAAWLEEGWLIASAGAQQRRVVRLEDIPAAMGGVVRHNIANALGAMCIALELGLSDEDVRKGLAAFKGDEQDNPGRGNWFEHEGIRMLVDFAHNEHGMNALADTVNGIEADRVVLLMGQAGDRLDKDIGDLTRAACRMQPDRLMICELPGYERGRDPFVVPGIIRKFALEAGLPERNTEIFPAPLDAVKSALDDARAGDLLVLLALTQRLEALELIHRFMER
jgi:UDP-N-acetylmuramyl tripeptide synthase